MARRVVGVGSPSREEGDEDEGRVSFTLPTTTERAAAPRAVAPPPLLALEFDVTNPWRDMYGQARWVVPIQARPSRNGRERNGMEWNVRSPMFGEAR